MTVLAANKPTPKRKVPARLIKEEMDGVPYYHKGFREVLAKKKTLEEIMGSSVLQVIILDAIKRYLYGVVSKDYIIASETLDDPDLMTRAFRAVAADAPPAKPKQSKPKRPKLSPK